MKAWELVMMKTWKLVMEISDGDSVLFDVCRVLNTKVWPKLHEGSKDDENLSLLLIDRYFDIEHTEPMKLWSKLHN